MEEETSAERVAGSSHEGSSRPGKRAAPTTYDETARRKRRCAVAGRPRYVERGNGRGTKRHAIVVGPAVMERTTDGQYDWRDAGFKRPRHI